MLSTLLKMHHAPSDIIPVRNNIMTLKHVLRLDVRRRHCEEGVGFTSSFDTLAEIIGYSTKTRKEMWKKDLRQEQGAAISQSPVVTEYTRRRQDKIQSLLPSNSMLFSPKMITTKQALYTCPNR